MGEPDLVLRARRLQAARGVVVARDVSLTASRGDVVAVEGPNGSGKTTLLAAAAGLLPAGSASTRPGSVGYSPERAGVLPRIALHQWLAGLARTSGLARDESARRTGDLLSRLGLAHASQVPLHALSRGNAQRALVAQALIADPDLVVLDEPTGGLDGEGVARVVAEIERAARRHAVVLVARHPTAPLPLPPGVTWQLRDGGVRARPRGADPAVPALPGAPPADGTTEPGGTMESAGTTGAAGTTGSAGTTGAAGTTGSAGMMEVETGDGVIHRVNEAGLPELLRKALDAGLVIRRVQPTARPYAAPAAAGSSGVVAGPTPERAGAMRRLLSGAAHRARLLASSQWFLAPGLLFLLVLAAVYATDAGPPLQAAAFSAIALIPVMTWLGILAHRVDGRELGRAFAAHAGGRARAHLATDLGLVPYAAALTAAALIAPLISQGGQPHPPSTDVKIVGLHLAAALFGAGIGSVLALLDRAGWRLIAAVAVFLALLVFRHTPLTPLLRLSTDAPTLQTSVTSQVAWLCACGAVLVAVAAWLVGRLT